jgi:hypothetical protein
LLSDSAFNPATNIVPAFKSLPGHVLSNSKQFFNSRLSTARIKIEHTNGLLKERFPILSSMKVLIKKDSDVLKVVKLVTACCILHNMLQNVPYLSIAELEKIMKTCPVDEDDPEFNMNYNDAEDGEARRNQLYDFILEKNNILRD